MPTTQRTRLSLSERMAFVMGMVGVLGLCFIYRAAWSQYPFVIDLEEGAHLFTEASGYAFWILPCLCLATSWLLTRRAERGHMWLATSCILTWAMGFVCITAATLAAGDFDIDTVCVKGRHPYCGPGTPLFLHATRAFPRLVMAGLCIALTVDAVAWAVERYGGPVRSHT